MSNFDFKHKITQVDGKPYFSLKRKEKAIKTSLDFLIAVLLLLCAIILASDLSKYVVEQVTEFLLAS